MRILLILLATFGLTGCWSSREASVYRASGTVNGQPIQVTVNGRTEKDSGVDVQAAIGAAVSAASGQYMQALEKLKPPSVDALADRLQSSLPKQDNTALYAGGGISLATLVAALLKEMHSHGKTKKSDDEAWSIIAEKAAQIA